MIEWPGGTLIWIDWWIKSTLQRSRHPQRSALRAYFKLHSRAPGLFCTKLQRSRLPLDHLFSLKITRVTSVRDSRCRKRYITGLHHRKPINQQNGRMWLNHWTYINRFEQSKVNLVWIISLMEEHLTYTGLSWGDQNQKLKKMEWKWDNGCFLFDSEIFIQIPGLFLSRNPVTERNPGVRYKQPLKIITSWRYLINWFNLKGRHNLLSKIFWFNISGINILQP